MMIKFLDDHCARENKKANNVVSAYDFLYLPMDFKKEKSKGYAFVNFTNYRAVWRFFHAFHDKTSVFLESSNSIMVVAAKVQGKEAQVKRFESTIFNCESEAFLPDLVAAEDGLNSAEDAIHRRKQMKVLVIGAV
ncbi:protein MEI2-like 7 [Ipomoea triloba]|uniref:protein MEI2-like 7 n=1 Tax=Ipomoea triloba TaxID=35885 RepID=UPI00125E10D4|nr:protein MEI2-like 7 [Ipomoea triloba]